MTTNLPPNTLFRSAAPIHDEDGDGYLIGYHLQYECHKKLVNIVFLSSVGPEDDDYLNLVKAEDKLLEKYDRATLSSQDGPDAESAVMEQEEAVHEEIRDWIEKLCRRRFWNLPEHRHISKLRSRRASFTTQDDGKLRVTQCSNDQPPPWPDSVQLTFFTLTKSILTASDHDDNLPGYPPQKITLVEAAAVPKVVVEEEAQVMCCKPNIRDYATTKEYMRLKKIKDARLKSLRVPSLRGLVIEEGGVIGLLLEFIEPSYSTLTAAMGEERAYYAPGVKPQKPSQIRKTKWARQIQQTVHQLHDIDVVWGDAKPDNILIDKEDNAWVLDFGGGWTVGWVDEDLADTREGDLQGLARMLKYLGVIDHGDFKPEQPEADRLAKKQKRRHSMNSEGASLRKL